MGFLKKVVTGAAELATGKDLDGDGSDTKLFRMKKKKNKGGSTSMRSTSSKMGSQQKAKLRYVFMEIQDLSFGWVIDNQHQWSKIQHVKQTLESAFPFLGTQ